MTGARLRRHVVSVSCAAVLAASCSGPPWYMGAPLNGRPSIPATTAHRSWKQQRAEATRAQAAGETVLELAALIALDDVDRLWPEQRARLAFLLARRAADFEAMGRAVPESRDLERLARLAPARDAGFLGQRALAARAAGDAWLAVGATASARETYLLARALGAADMDFRIAALWEHPPPATTPLAELRAAIATLPLRAVPPFASAYLARGGGDAATLGRGLAAARQEGPAEGGVLAARLEAALRRGGEAPVDAGPAPDGGTPDAAVPPSPADAGGDAAPDLAPLAPVPPDLDHWILGGPTVAARLFPIVRAHPTVLDDVPRSLKWVDLLLAEDPTSPDALELAALTFGRAKRFGGTERMLAELVYESPDRAEGFERGARVWERLGRAREACVQWLRAARWRDVPEDPTWRTAITCARHEPGVADWRDIRAYVLARARPERRAAIASELDGL